MRKIYAALLSLFFLLVWNSVVKAQVSLYNFTQSSGTYTENTDPGRVILGSTTSDDQVFNNNTTGQTAPVTNTGFPIGFNFTYNGVVYDKFAVNTNGWIVVGTGSFQIGASSGSNYTPLSSAGPAGVVNAIAGLARDLQGQTGSELSYQTLGDAPNRILVVQWKGFRRFLGTGQSYNFQIRLHETTNQVSIIYGTFSESSATSGNPQVGLRGATNADYNNRTGLWPTSTAGAVNSASMTLSTVANGTPVSGLTFTWAPPGPCSGTPAGGTTQSSVASACAGANFTLSVTGVPNATGYTYHWETSPNGTTWTPLPTSAFGLDPTQATLTISQNTNTYYRRKITCGANSSWSSSLLVPITVSPLPLVENFSTFTTAASALPGCWTRNTATFVYGAPVSGFGAGTGAVRFDFYNAAAGSNLDLVSPLITPTTAGYQLSFDHAYATFFGEVDRLEIHTSTDGGNTYTLLTTYLGGASGPLNTGGSVLPSFVPTATQWATKTIALPTGTNRIIFRGVSAFGNNLYLDNIRLATCLPPTGLTASSITQTTATVSWAASPSNPANGYQWEIRTSGAGGSGATGLTTSGSTAAGVTTANATGLTANTTYNLYVRSDCSGSDFSDWVGPFTFTTPCNPVTLPLLETFASTTFPPTCWSRNNTTFLLRSTTNAYGATGTGSARYNFWSATSGTFDLVTPQFTATPAGYGLLFDHAYATFSGEVDRLEIHYSTDGGNTYTLLTTYLGGSSGPLNTGGVTGNPFASFVPTASQWATKGIILPTGTNRLIFRGISAFGDDLFIDNIRLASCLPPTGLTASAIAQTTATVSWTASVSNPSNGYQWEVRTSGAGGSGATGLTASGSTAAGVTTANVAGLTPNTTYNLYVRSDCGGSDFSVWAGPYTFTTLCNPLPLPLLENFSTFTAVGSAVPTCWTRNSATFLFGASASGYGVGTGSARFDFYNAPAGTQIELVSPAFTPTGAGYGLVFDHAYATFFGEVDRLEIFYSTDGGSTYTSLINYNGGTAGPLNTGGAVLPAFIPTAAQWATKALALPTGTNRLLFRGVSAFGNNLYLDNIQVVSCLPPTGLSVTAIGTTTATGNWTASASNPASGYQWEVRTTGAPGSGATGLAASSTTAAGVTTASITGLTPGTTYSFYVRSDCGGADYSIWAGPFVFTTECDPFTIPLLENFSTFTAVGSAPPTCWRRNNSTFLVGNTASANGVGTGSAKFDFYNAAAGTQLNLISPTFAPVPANYQLVFDHAYATFSGENDQLQILYSTDGGTTYTTLTTYAGGASGPLNTAGALLPAFTPTGSQWAQKKVLLPVGTNRLIFRGISAFGNNLYLDNINIKAVPQVDVGISGITLPTLNCPTNAVFIQSEIRNYNLLPVDFSVTPVNVNARIVLNGTTTTNLPATVINSGVLAPNATMGIYLGTAYNFVGGVHDITLNTTSPLDTELRNDTLRRTVIVNANPATPVITPSAPQICLGSTVQLSTQFTASPPPVDLTTNSGTLTLAIPDNNPAGVSHTIAVSGVPANATVTGISVTLNANHTWNSDLVFNLRAPNGQVLNLVNRKGGSGDNFTNCVISSASTTALPTAATSPVTGTFAADAATVTVPTGFASTVNNFAALYTIPNGNWTLAVNDNVGLDVGTLTGWSITITYQVITPTITWSPVTGLFTNAAATTAYTSGSNAYSVFAKPATTGSFTYVVTATTPAGCTASANAVVTVNPNPVVTVGNIPDTVCISDQVVPLVGNPAGGTWSGIGVSGNNFLPPTTAVGNFLLTYNYTNQFGCPGSATKRIWVKDCPERIVLLRDNAIILFPNPTDDGRFNIRINSVLYNNLTMRVYTNNGALVRTQQFGGLVYGRVIPIDLSALPGGVYIVEFANENAGPRTAEKSFKVIIGH